MIRNTATRVGFMFTFLLVVATVFAQNTTGTRQQSNQAKDLNQTMTQDQRWWERQFVISTFASVRPGDNIEQIIDLLHEAGLNALESNTPLEYAARDLSPDENRRVLDACQKYGMKFFITDHARLTGVAKPTREALEALVKDYASHPALGGYYLWDEPKAEQFETVAMMNSTLRQLDPAHLALNAMLPSYGPYGWPDAYPNFVHQFVEAVNPAVLSFDFYSVNDGGIASNLYRDLGLWGEMSVKAGKPFWFYLSSCKWASIARPTRATISFQDWTAIAYGAKGLQYFVAKDFTGGAVDFVGAPITADGQKGAIFADFAALNGEIMRQSPTIMSLMLERVAHTAPAPPEVVAAVDAGAFKPGFAGLQEAPGDLLLALHRDGQNRPYLIVVSKNLQEAREVTLKFQDETWLIDALDGKEYKTAGKAVTLHFAPGAGRLFRVER